MVCSSGLPLTAWRSFWISARWLRSPTARNSVSSRTVVARGSWVRARVPAAISDQDALDLYNLVNGSRLQDLFEVE